MGFTQQEIFRGAYERNFTQTFGEVDPGQSWDLSSYGLTRAGNEDVPVGYTPIPVDEQGYYNLESNTMTWLSGQLPESTDNKTTAGVSAFSMIWQPGQVFEIIPIYQGQYGQVWSLWIEVDGTPVQLWKRSEGMQKKTSATGAWRDLAYTSGYTRGAAAVRSKPILISKERLFPEKDVYGKEIVFYIQIDQADNRWGHYAEVGDKASTTNEKIAFLRNCPNPSNIPDSYDVRVLGCEDGIYTTDNDYNDVVFLLAGDVPEPIYDEGDINADVKKRYMMEDITDRGDYDFNDVVVDVVEKAHQHYRRQTNDTGNGQQNVIIWDEREIDGYEATVTWLCGTVPTMVQVGDTWFGQVTDPTDVTLSTQQLLDGQLHSDGKTYSGDKTKIGCAPKVTKEVTGWTPENNKIMLKSWINGNPYGTGDSEVFTSSFPEKGEVPFIIATNQTLQWMPEGVDIPETWWKDGAFNK